MTAPTSCIRWQCLSFEQLSNQQIYAIFQARSAVFVVEQNCVYQDIDGKDPKCWHLFASSASGEILAYLRIVPAGLSYAELSLGRVLTSAAGRGLGLGKQLLEQSLDFCQLHFPQQAIRISAQAYLEKFYQSFGFKTVSEPYLEDDIPHLQMLKA